MLTQDQLRVDSPPVSQTIDALREAWRQAHFAAQAGAEFAKSWAIEKKDDSHSSFLWTHDDSFIGISGEPSADTAHRARLRIDGLALSLVDSSGSTAAETSLDAMTVDSAIAWIRDAAQHTIGPPRQPARPAPDLPEHPLADGAPLRDVGPPLVALRDLYDLTARTLLKLQSAMPAFTEARCWPHHFDLASLAVITTDASGNMTSTIGVGITPPDALHDHGYWYVSPWTRDDPPSAEYPDLHDGHWHDRSGVSMAILPISSVLGSADLPDRLARFIAQATNACTEILDA